MIIYYKMRSLLCFLSTPFLFHSLTHTHTYTHTDCSSDEWRRISDVVEAFSLDEIGHIGREVLVVSFDVVLQNQTTQRASGLVFSKGHREKSILKCDQEDRQKCLQRMSNVREH